MNGKRTFCLDVLHILFSPDYSSCANAYFSKLQQQTSKWPQWPVRCEKDPNPECAYQQRDHQRDRRRFSALAIDPVAKHSPYTKVGALSAMIFGRMVIHWIRSHICLLELELVLASHRIESLFCCPDRVFRYRPIKEQSFKHVCQVSLDASEQFPQDFGLHATRVFSAEGQRR